MYEGHLALQYMPAKTASRPFDTVTASDGTDGAQQIWPSVSTLSTQVSPSAQQALLQ